MNRGHTLLELLLVITLITTAGSFVAGTVRRVGDDIAARAIREEIVTLVHGARARARARGGARLVLRSDGRHETTAGGSVRPGALSLPSRAGVRLPGGRDSTTIRFDRLGLARMASTTVSVQVGEAERVLVISSYGRLRRR